MICGGGWRLGIDPLDLFARLRVFDNQAPVVSEWPRGQVVKTTSQLPPFESTAPPIFSTVWFEMPGWCETIQFLVIRHNISHHAMFAGA
jgi:hypothetical protein